MHLLLPEELPQRHVNDTLVFHCPFFGVVSYPRSSFLRTINVAFYDDIERSKIFHPPREMESPLGFRDNAVGFVLSLRGFLRQCWDHGTEFTVRHYDC